jgi:hypothetical protein
MCESVTVKSPYSVNMYCKLILAERTHRGLKLRGRDLFVQLVRIYSRCPRRVGRSGAIKVGHAAAQPRGARLRRFSAQQGAKLESFTHRGVE